MREEDHDFFFVKTKDKPHSKNAIVVSPVQKKQKKKSKKEEKKAEEDAQVIPWFPKALFYRFYISDTLNKKLKLNEISN